MFVPTLSGIIDRRILINYRIDPVVLASILPPPFRPKLVDGVGLAGICLIRLRQIRPRLFPAWLGIGSENAAYRIAVEWEQDGAIREGVYIPRRDTSSWLNTLAGQRLFPGAHHHARFDVHEAQGEYRVAIESDDGQTQLSVKGHIGTALPDDSALGSLHSASAFFQCGSLGYSPSLVRGQYDGLELKTLEWNMLPLTVDNVTSSFFENQSQFPRGTAEFDSGLLMRNVGCRWLAQPSLTAECPVHRRGPILA
jgi:hypothetical protein